MPNRRHLLQALIGIGAGVGSTYLFRANHRIPPSDGTAEERFRILQDRVFARFGMLDASHFHELLEPSLRLHTIEAGTGEPALFIHGENSVAAGLAPLLAGMYKTFQVLAPDRPGCGLTTKFNYQGVDLRRRAVAFVAATMESY